MDTTKSLGTLVWYTCQSRAVSINLDLDVLKAAVACFFHSKDVAGEKEKCVYRVQGEVGYGNKAKAELFLQKRYMKKDGDHKITACRHIARAKIEYMS